MLESLSLRPVQPETKARMIDCVFISTIPQFPGKARKEVEEAYRITISRIQIIIIDATNSILITFGTIIKACKNQIRDICRDEVTEFFQAHNEGGADETTPVRIPGVVDFLGVVFASNRWLFGLLLVVTVPDLSSICFLGQGWGMDAGSTHH